MIRPSFIVVPFILISSICGSARATPPLTLSLNDAVARAEALAPEVVLARSAVTVAEARSVGAGIVMPNNPRLSVEGRPALSNGPFSSLGYASNLDFMFDVGGAPRARVHEADAHAAAARADLAVERREARVRAWTAYLHARAGDERIAGIDASLEIADRVLFASRERANLGAAGDSELTLSESERAELAALLESAKERREAALMELRDALDLPADQPLSLTTALELPPEVAPLPALEARALQARPELAALRSRLALLDATYERLGKETFPKVGTYLGIDAAPASPVFGMLGLSVELPFVQRNQGPRAVTSALRDSDARKLDLQGRRILREVLDARASYESARARLNVLSTSALPAVERTLALIEAGWRSGRFDIFRVTSAARDVARVRSLRLDALESAWTGRIALDRAVGGLGS